MRKRAIALGLALSWLVCSGFSYTGERSKVTFEVLEDYVQESEDYGTVSLDGKYIKLPCKVSLFTDLGYEISSEADRVLPAKSESYGMRVHDTKGRELNLYVRNDADKEMPAQDCMAWAVVYKPLEDKDYGSLDLKISGVAPDAAESVMVEKLGLPGSTMDVDGTTYAMWSTAKDEYTIAIDYWSSGIVQMKVYVDKPAAELKSSMQEYYHAKYPKEFDEVVSSGGKTAGKILAYIGIGVVVIMVLFVGVTFYFIRLNHKRRMAEINAEILRTPIEDIPDDLEEKYRE